MDDTTTFARSQALRGAVGVPGDKSISHRAVLFSALAAGQTAITNLSDGADAQATLRCLRQLGLHIEGDAARTVVHGQPLAQWQTPAEVLDCGNSGTTLRLLMGVLAAAPGLRATLTGDASLCARPMRRLAEPLQAIGGELTTSAAGTPPVSVIGQSLRGGLITLPMASAQLKSALLLAGLHAVAPVRVREPLQSRDHTERMLAAMGAELRQVDGGWQITPGPLRPLGDFVVPGDPSSAAFAAAVAVLHPDAALTIGAVCLNPTRTGWLSVLRRMGALLDVTVGPTLGGEPCGTIAARSGPLLATEVTEQEVPACIDEVPVLALCAAAATGTSHFGGLAELRVKESDRLAAIVRLLAGLGVATRSGADWMAIDGAGSAENWHPLARFDPGHDHRMALCAAIAGLVGPHPVSVANWSTTATSWPAFRQTIAAVGQLKQPRSLIGPSISDADQGGARTGPEAASEAVEDRTAATTQSCAESEGPA